MLEAGLERRTGYQIVMLALLQTHTRVRPLFDKLIAQFLLVHRHSGMKRPY